MGEEGKNEEKVKNRKPSVDGKSMGEKMSNTNINKKKIIIILLAFIMVAVMIICFINSKAFQRIYGKLYTGNHINLDLSIYYDGKLINADDMEIVCVNPENDVEKIDKNGSKYSVKGGKYGKYIFTVTIEDDFVIELHFLNMNDWYISNSICNIEVKNVDGLLNCDCRIKTEYNDGTTVNSTKQKPLENGKVVFLWQ